MSDKVKVKGKPDKTGGITERKMQERGELISRNEVFNKGVLENVNPPIITQEGAQEAEELGEGLTFSRATGTPWVGKTSEEKLRPRGEDPAHINSGPQTNKYSLSQSMKNPLQQMNDNDKRSRGGMSDAGDRLSKKSAPGKAY